MVRDGGSGRVIGKTACWYETQQIEVIENDGPDRSLYPYRLNNLNTQSDEAEATAL